MSEKTPEEIAAEAAAKDETIKKLEEQVENLNKGIAATRDDAKTAIEAAKAANDALEVFKKETAKNVPEVQLSAEEQKKFEAWAKANGVVTQAELAAERNARAGEAVKEVSATAINDFLEKHPEYDDDDQWAKVQAEFNLYKTPTDLASYKKLLERIHLDLNPEDAKERAKAQARAELKKQEILKKGGGSQGKTSVDAELEAEIDKMQSKYPNLSREQIEARLSEVKNMYAGKKKD